MYCSLLVWIVPFIDMELNYFQIQIWKLSSMPAHVPPNGWGTGRRNWYIRDSKDKQARFLSRSIFTFNLVYSWFKRQTSEIFVPLYSLSTFNPATM